jgi:hypothetical protein
MQSHVAVVLSQRDYAQPSNSIALDGQTLGDPKQKKTLHGNLQQSAATPSCRADGPETNRVHFPWGFEWRSIDTSWMSMYMSLEQLSLIFSTPLSRTPLLNLEAKGTCFTKPAFYDTYFEAGSWVRLLTCLGNLKHHH